MTYICVKCNQKWVVDEPTDHISGGICRECITLYIHSKQLRNGDIACFGTHDQCNDARRCKYGELCLA